MNKTIVVSSKFADKNKNNSNFNKTSQRVKEDYDIKDLKYEDETDDEERPKKPIPIWARDQNIYQTSAIQSLKYINFTNLFKSCCHEEINLEKVFIIKKKNFNQRSSSADWKSSPSWKPNIKNKFELN